MKVILLAVFGAVLHQPAYFQIKENHLTRATVNKISDVSRTTHCSNCTVRFPYFIPDVLV